MENKRNMFCEQKGCPGFGKLLVEARDDAGNFYLCCPSQIDGTHIKHWVNDAKKD